MSRSIVRTLAAAPARSQGRATVHALPEPAGAAYRVIGGGAAAAAAAPGRPYAASPATTPVTTSAVTRAGVFIDKPFLVERHRKRGSGPPPSELRIPGRCAQGRPYIGGLACQPSHGYADR